MRKAPARVNEKIDIRMNVPLKFDLVKRSLYDVKTDVCKVETKDRNYVCRLPT